MHNIMAVSIYEIKMMLRRLGFWGILIFALVISIWDNFPSKSNLSRLSFLAEPGYLVSRLLVQTGLLIMFGVMFLVSNTIAKDKKTGVDQLLMTSNISKKQYIIGKFIGNFIPTMLMFGLYFLVHAVIQIVLIPEASSLKAYLFGYFILAVAASFFVIGISISLPMWIDIRIFYALMALYFLANLLIVPDSTTLPFWFLFYGDLIKIIYNYGFGVLIIKNVILNILFLVGIGALSVFSLMINKRFWRDNVTK